MGTIAPTAKCICAHRKKKNDNGAHSAEVGKHLKDKEWDPAGMLRTASCLTWSWLHSRTLESVLLTASPSPLPGAGISKHDAGKENRQFDNIQTAENHRMFSSPYKWYLCLPGQLFNLPLSAQFQSIPVEGVQQQQSGRTQQGGSETHIRGTVQDDFHLSIKRLWPEDGH